MNKSILFISSVAGACMTICLLGTASFYYLYQNQNRLQKQIEQYIGDACILEKQIDVSGQAHVIEKVIAKTEIWRPIQEQVKDTVVQVFCHKLDYDILRPFKTPEGCSSCGSGFFINKEGYLVTNAHVVSQASAIWIQIPSLGKRIIDVSLIGMSPERDLALLKVTDEGLNIIQQELGAVPFLPLGDSDRIRRSDEVMALGYPLGQQSLKSTTGVISGREHRYIQMSAAINPGNSGGPLLDVHGNVVGVNSAGIMEAQNVGYIIPINDLKIILEDLYHVKLLRKPYLGVFYNNSTEALTEFLGNPMPGGCYIVEVIKDSPLYKSGVQRGDMIYSIDGHPVDIYGDMKVPWCEDKIAITDYVSRLSIGQEIKLILYRKGVKKEVIVTFDHTQLPAIRQIYPGIDPIEYEIMCGMVVMPLTLNHIHRLVSVAPKLVQYAETQYQSDPVLVVTHIFPNSELYRSRAVTVGSTLIEVNGIPVKTLDDFRSAMKSGVGSKFLTLKLADNILRTTEDIFIALPFDKVLAQEAMLAQNFNYQLSDIAKELLQSVSPKLRKHTLH